MKETFAENRSLEVTIHGNYGIIKVFAKGGAWL